MGGALLAASAGLAATEGPPPTIAIIIDDMGHKKAAGERLIGLDAPLTLAFLPFRRHTPDQAELAHRQGKEIMLHAPMANLGGFPLGPGGLEPDMTPDAVGHSLRRSLQSVPHVRGVNNHMGSLLTQSAELMQPIMSELRRYPLYFVDSRTIATTVAEDVALAQQVPALSRDVFLDHEQTREYVHRQFQELLETARRNGSAIAIGHPHEVTVSYLEEVLPRLGEEGVAIATIGALWRMRHQDRPMFSERRQPVPSTPVVARRGQDEDRELLLVPDEDEQEVQ